MNSVVSRTISNEMRTERGATHDRKAMTRQTKLRNTKQRLIRMPQKRCAHVSWCAARNAVNMTPLDYGPDLEKHCGKRR
jgi:hypothetical protein